MATLLFHENKSAKISITSATENVKISAIVELYVDWEKCSYNVGYAARTSVADSKQ